jgi:hypothetical protein
VHPRDAGAFHDEARTCLNTALSASAPSLAILVHWQPGGLLVLLPEYNTFRRETNMALGKPSPFRAKVSGATNDVR